MAVVSVGTSSKVINNLLETHGLQNLSELHSSQIAGKVKVFLNGSWLGIHNEPEKLITILKDKRRSHFLEKEVSIIYNYSGKEIK